MNTCSTDSTYRGMAHDKIETAKDIPPMPKNSAEQNQSSALALQADDCNTYRQVKFHGNYGLLCGQYQEFMRYNINDAQISQIGWAAFGTCGWNADRS